MTLYDAVVEVDFLDSAERTATVSYLLQQQYDTTANTGAGNMDDVLTAASDLVTALDVLTWDHISQHRVSLVVPDSGASANVAANNQVVAFSRVVDAGGANGRFEVPAWDDAVYDQDSNNLLSPAYNVAASLATNLLKNPDTGSDFGNVSWSQSRAHKSRGKKLG